MTIAGWISNSCHLLSYYLHSRLLSSAWTLLGPPNLQQTFSSMEYTTVSSAVGCCAASQHLWIRRSWGLIPVQCPLKLDILERYVMLLKIRPWTLPAYHEVSLESCSLPLTGSTGSLCMVASTAHCHGYTSPLSMTTQPTELAALLLPTEPGLFKQTNLNSSFRFIPLIFTEVGLGPLAHCPGLIVEWADQSSNSP